MHWNKETAGVWKATIGVQESLNPISIMREVIKKEGFQNLGEADFPVCLSDMKLEIKNGKIVASIPLLPEERIYGLGLQFMKINHRGRTRVLRVNSDPKQDTGESHAPVPFYISNQGYGLFFNTSRIVTLYCGSCVRKDSGHPPVPRDQNTDPDFEFTPQSDSMEAVIQAQGIEVLVFGGSNILEVVQRYNQYFGGGVLPPRWGLGFWHRVPTLYNAQQVLEEAMEYRKWEIPCDVIGLEPGWHSKSYPVTYTWSKERFPDPAAFIQVVAKEGFKINLWEHGYISPDSPVYSELEPFSGSHTVWGGLAPDYSIGEARDILKRIHKKEHIDIGVAGYKLDECDGSEFTNFSWMFPAHAAFPSGNDGEQMRQVYGLYFQKITSELFREAGRRTYGLVRASGAAASTLPYVLYSDLYDHREFVKAMVNSSFSGLLWTPEVRSAKNTEDWVRRFQTVCFSPLAMLNAWADGTKPWTYPEAIEIVKKYVRLRMQLMPYFYSAFAKYRFEGIPPFRALHLEPGYDPQKVGEMYKKVRNYKKQASWDTFDDEIGDQYMAGDCILVAPLFEGETKRLIYLPEGNWYEFETAKEYSGGGFIDFSAPLDKIPLFVRDGSIIPMMPSMNCMPRSGDTVPLEVRVYGKKPGYFMLYDDDGESFDYEDGKYRWIRLETCKGKNGQLQGVEILHEQAWRSFYSEINWVFMN